MVPASDMFAIAVEVQMLDKEIGEVQASLEKLENQNRPNEAENERKKLNDLYKQRRFHAGDNSVLQIVAAAEQVKKLDKQIKATEEIKLELAAMGMESDNVDQQMAMLQRQRTDIVTETTPAASGAAGTR